MKRIFLFLLTVCFACSRPLSTLRQQHAVTAMLNDSVWYGRANAGEAAALNDSACANGKLLLMFETNSGYVGDQLRLSAERKAMQAGEFVPRQRLTFYNVPAQKGKHHLSELNQCGGIVLRQGNFALLGNGSALIEAYFVQPDRPNWVRITQLDSTTRTITGKFKATLINSMGRAGRFRKGRFVAKLPK